VDTQEMRPAIESAKHDIKQAVQSLENSVAELQERVRPSLTEEQQSRFFNALKESPKGTVDIQCDNKNAWHFSNQIASLLKRAEWNFTVGMVEFNGPAQGIIVVVRSVENLPANALQEALKLVGFPPTYFGEAPPPDIVSAAALSPRGDGIILIIGHKP
jgi:hypothetical protein